MKKDKEEKKRKEAHYSMFLDAISYRLEQLSESINTKYLPKELQDELQEKIDKLLEIRSAFY